MDKFLKIKTRPQMAFWIEDKDGNYIDTIYVTKKTAKQSWAGAPSTKEKNIRRKESLPYWAHKRGVIYEDNLYLPTKKSPLPDTITGATPKSSFTIESNVSNKLKTIVVCMEINHSCDFNDFFPKTAKKGDKDYSGGELGSGQPALVYKGELNFNSLIGYKIPVIMDERKEISKAKMFKGFVRHNNFSIIHAFNFQIERMHLTHYFDSPMSKNGWGSDFVPIRFGQITFFELPDDFFLLIGFSFCNGKKYSDTTVGNTLYEKREYVDYYVKFERINLLFGWDF